MIIFIYVILFLILLSALFGALSAAPWLPTKNKDVMRMIELAGIKEGDVIYDLGCGDGRLVFAAARRGAIKSVGIEIFFLPYLYALIKSFFIPRTKIVFGDFFSTDISDATVVFVFLLNKSYGKLLDKFKKELKPGTRVIVSCWPINELPEGICNKPTETDLPLYSYIIH